MPPFGSREEYKPSGGLDKTYFAYKFVDKPVTMQEDLIYQV